MDRVRHLVRLRVILLGLAGVGVAACKGDDEGNTDDTDTDDVQAAHFVFNQSVVATEYVAEVIPEALQAHQISSMLLASTAIVVADEKVQDRLNTDGGGGARAQFRAGALDCWERPQFPMFSFTIDYTACEPYQMAGGVFINDHPSGPLLFEFSNFQILGPGGAREITGVLAFDTRDAFEAPLYWQTYNTGADNPHLELDPEAELKLGVEVDRTTFGVSYHGGASVDFLTQQWSMWGVASIGFGEEALTVVHGGLLPEDVAPNEPSGVDVMKSPLNWLECRCPTSGLSALDMPLQFTSVTVDIDDLEDVPDEIDDPSMEIPIDFQLAGQGILTTTGCGTYDVGYQTQAVEIPLSRDQLVGAVSFQCITLAVEDELRCAAMVAAANQLESDLLISVSTEAATATAAAAVDRDFDTTWCKIY